MGQGKGDTMTFKEFKIGETVYIKAGVQDCLLAWRLTGALKRWPACSTITEIYDQECYAAKQKHYKLIGLTDLFAPHCLMTMADFFDAASLAINSEEFKAKNNDKTL